MELSSNGRLCVVVRMGARSDNHPDSNRLNGQNVLVNCLRIKFPGTAQY